MDMMEIRRRVMAMATGGILPSGYETTVLNVTTAITNASGLLALIQTLPDNDVAIGVMDRDWSETPTQSDFLWFSWWGSASTSAYGRWRGSVNANTNWTSVYDCIIPAGSKIIVVYKPATT